MKTQLEKLSEELGQLAKQTEELEKERESLQRCRLVILTTKLGNRISETVKKAEKYV